MYYPLFIANRLSLKVKGDRGAATGMTVGIVGVAMAVMIMILAMAIVTGFKHDIKRKLQGLNSDITLYHPDAYITLTPQLGTVLDEAAPGASVSVVTDRTGILKTSDQFQAVTFRGLDSGYDLGFLASTITHGSFDGFFNADEDEGVEPMVLSAAVGGILGVGVGDKLTAYFIENGDARVRRYRIIALYNTHFGDYDRGMVFVPKESLSFDDAMLAGKAGTSVLIDGLPENEITPVAQALYERLLAASADGDIDTFPVIDTLLHSQELYYNWLSLLDTNVVVILSLMGVVAAFTLISSLFILILRRVRMIGILRSLGAANRQVSDIFVILSLRVVGYGIVIGTVVGVVLLWIQNAYHVLSLDSASYYLDYVPVLISWQQIAAVDLCVAVISLLVLLLPSRLVSSISPASVMRYE